MSAAPIPADAEGRLSHAEATDLARLEAVIERGLDAFIEVATALIEIRDHRLYRATHRTFEAYVGARFGLARRTAYGYIEAARVARALENVPTSAQLSLSQLCALAPLSPDDQRELAPLVSEMTVIEARRVIRERRRQKRERHADLPEPPPFPTGTFRSLVLDVPWPFDKADFSDGLAADQVAFTISRETLVGGEFGEGMTLDDYVQAIGLPSGGAVRASLGLASNAADLERFAAFASRFVDVADVPDDLPQRVGC